LGKSFHEYSLIEDQRYILQKLLKTLSDPSYSVLVISGDIFDRSIPSQEASQVFSAFLGELKNSRPLLKVLMIPGNHDSAVRLGYGKELFSGLGIHIGCGADNANTPVVIDSDGERCAFFLLPYLYPSGLAEEASKELEDARKNAVSNGADCTVLLAHLFCRGGKSSDSERTFLGQAEQVNPGLFSGFDYVALGHLHRPQKAAVNAWYAGSPLAYSFDEAESEKCFLSVTLTRGEKTTAGLSVEVIPVEPLRPLRRLAGSFTHFLKDTDAELKEAENCFLEITLSGGELTENALPLLRGRFPYLLMVRQDEARAAIQTTLANKLPEGENRNVLDDFREFLEEIYGEADNEKIACFNEILESLGEEA
jgi:exonuclease SbcD